jgi:hypothetical protein
VRPVFERIVETAVRLLRCDMTIFFTCDDATYSPVVGATPQGPLAELGPTNLPIDPSANFPSRAVVEQKMLYLPDWSLIDLPEHERHIHAIFDVNSALYLPLLREGQCIGVLALGDKRANAFSAGEIALAESFRDQAAIAIENVRLFEAEQQRTRELSESLEQQTATSEVLKVISSSPGDLEPVFATIPRRVGGSGSIDRGAQNLPGNWESKKFNLPLVVHSQIPRIGDEDTSIVLHNDAVVQGLSEVPYMHDVERWGILTIGTGLGNARFTNRRQGKP